MSVRAAAGELQTLFVLGQVGDWTDGQLLEQFRSGKGPVSDAAFRVLVSRHGPMVLRVCRGVLSDEHDTEDAFQATFLVLVRQARAVRKQASVASWLYGVAHRVASRAKVETARRRLHERRAAATVPQWPGEAGEWHGADAAVLDEEIRRLPRTYRVAVVLCYLEGLSQEQAARQLGWPAGTVRGRLSRARTLLRTRLARRGLGVPAGLAAAGLTTQETLAAVPAVLLDSTVRAAVLAGAGKTVAAGAVSATAAALADATVRTAVLSQISVPTVLLGLGLAAASTGILSTRLTLPWADRGAEPRAEAAPPAPLAEYPDLARDGAENESPVQASSTRSSSSLDGPLLSNSAAPAPARGDGGQPVREPSIAVFPLERIVVDGDLGDWPRGIERHRLDKIVYGERAGYGPFSGVAPSARTDLDASFSVGYDPERQLLYLALVVRDDRVVVGHQSHLDTDAAEVYIDGLCSSRRITNAPGNWWEHTDLATAPVQQYIAIPGPGRIYGTMYPTNPILLAGDLTRTRTRMAYRRAGDVTTYEWAIEPFDRYPDAPSRLEPGKRIGFDVAVADRDVRNGRTDPKPIPGDNGIAWIYWGPQWTGMKVLDAGNLGELVLAPPR